MFMHTFYTMYKTVQSLKFGMILFHLNESNAFFLNLLNDVCNHLEVIFGFQNVLNSICNQLEDMFIF